MVDDAATSAFPGAVVGFVSWLRAWGTPFLLYGPNTLFFFLYTWPFFLALMPGSGIIGIALHLLVNRI
ncbi:YgbE [Salmonella enterica subsp. enterica serovar Agona str. 57.A.08]|nr:YgbE [Salmonella enterica subsp. enterica serovar Agona str. 57.A.08]